MNQALHEVIPTPIGLMSPPEVAPISRLRRTIIAGMAVLSLATGCEDTQSATPPTSEAASLYSEPIQQEIAFHNLSKHLNVQPPEIAEARQLVPVVTKGDPLLTTAVGKALDFATAEALLSGADRSDSSINDPTLSDQVNYLLAYRSGSERTADNSRQSLAQSRMTALKDLDAALSDSFATKAAITPTVLTELQPYDNPHQKVDLSQLKATTLTPNACRALGLSDHCGPTGYQQFGEIAAVDGKLQMRLQEGGGMTAKLQEQFQTAFDHNRPLLEAAFASGELVTVRLILSGMGFNPGYRAESRELLMTLPKDDSTTLELLTTSMTHETLHALTRNLYQEIGVSKDELSQLMHTCNELRRGVYEDFEDLLYLHPKWLDTLRDQAKPEHVALIDRVREAVKEGGLAEILAQTPAQLAAEPLSALVNQCANTDNGNRSLSDRSLLLDARDDAASLATPEELAYLFESESYKILSDNWLKVLRRDSLYSRVIDEANYVDVGTGGHSRDNAPEAQASTLDDVMNYRPQFDKKLADPNESDTARRAVIDWTIFNLTYLADRHPSLNSYCTELITHYRNLY